MGDKPIEDFSGVMQGAWARVRELRPEGLADVLPSAECLGLETEERAALRGWMGCLK